MDTAIPELESSESLNSVISQEPFLQPEESNISDCEAEISSSALIVSDVQSNDDQSPKSQVKRKRGRPPKKLSEYVEDEQPLRVSKRKRKKPSVIKYDVENMKCLWTKKDKIQFLKALEEVGPENLEALQSYLPHKTENDIQNQIRMWSNFARIELQKKVLSAKGKMMKSGTMNAASKLDEWIQHFEELEEISPPRLYALANIFLLIAEYGNFPQPKEFNGLDLRAMYRYIHCMLNGQPHYGMNQQTANVINNCIANIFLEFRNNKTHMDKLQSHLFYSSNSKRQNMRTYSRLPSRKLSACTSISEILSRPDMNPLSIEPKLLSKPAFFISSDTSDSDV